MSKAEGKGEGKDDGGGAEVPKSVVIDLVNFAMRIVHQDMAAFFDEHCDLWDYSEAQIAKLNSGEGESLQQHDVFRKYLEIITGHLDDFASSAGYDSARSVFDQVQAAIEKDKNQRNKMMNELTSMFAKLKKHNKKDDEAEAKGGEAKGGNDEKEESKGGGEAKTASAQPVMVFSQPIGLEYLLDSIVGLGEYETLRMMMIMKCRERKMFAQIAKRSKERKAAAVDRRAALQSNPSEGVLCDEYAALCARLLEMTPARGELHEQVNEGMPKKAFEADCRRGQAADPKLYEFATAHVLRLCSLSANSEVEGAAEKLKNDDATHAEWLLCFHEHVDKVHDDVEKSMLESRRNPVGGGASSASAAQAK